MRRSVVLFALACATNAFAGVNTWTFTGPEGGAAQSVAFHPDPGVVIALAGSSIYRSEDGGSTWAAKRTGLGAGIGRVLVHPTNPNLVMISSVNSMYRSDDRGQTFGTIGSPGATSVLAMPADGSALYAGSGAFDSKVYRSTDFGASWQDRSVGLPGATLIVDLVVDPTSSNTLYALLDSGGLYRTTNGGQQWAIVNPLTNLNAKKLAIDPGAPTQMLLATYNGLLQKSIDSGATWTLDSTAPLTGYAWVGFAPAAAGQQNGAALAIPYNGQVIHRTARGQPWVLGQQVKLVSVGDVGFDASKTDPNASTLFLATAEGPLLSKDSGVTFAAKSSGIRGSYVPNLVAARDIEGTMYAAFGSGPLGIYRRTLSGWNAVDNVELRNKLVSPFQPFALAVDPVDALTLIVQSNGAAMSSIDGGQSWSGPNADLGGIGAINAIEYARSNPLYAYAGGSNGVYRSINHGVTWFSFSSGLPTAIGVLAVDPTNHLRVFAAPFQLTPPPLLYRTTDGGVTWAPADTGLNAQWISSIAIDPSNSQTLYAGGGGTGSGMFKSTDGGQSWARVGGNGAVSLSIDPVVTTTLVMTINALGGASRSVDGGISWENLPSPPPGAFVLLKAVVDPLKPSNIVATGNDVGLLELEVQPDLAVSFATAPPATLALGGSGAATVRVTNQGPLAASAVVMNLTLPAGATAVATPAQGTCTSTAGGFRCALGAMHVGDHVDVSLSLTAGNTPGLSALSASITAHESDPVANNDSVSAPVTIKRVADLGVTLASSATVVDQHASLTLTATATNSGPNASTATQVAIDLGTGFGYQNATPSKGTCSQSGTVVTCSLGILNPSTSATIAVAVTADGVGALPAGAHISDAGLQDPTAANDSATVSVTSRRIADLGVTLASSATTVDHRAALTLTATVTNSGPHASTVTQVAIDLGTAFGYQGATPSKGSCTQSGTVVTCTVGALDPATSATIAVSVTADGIGTLTAGARISDVSLQDPNAANDSASVSVTSRRVADLAVQITDAADPVTAGQPLGYTATVTNNGPDDAVSATVTINVAGATVTSATTAQGTCTPSGSTVSCALNNVANGASATISIATSAGSAGTATADATVSSGGTDKTSTNDAATQSTTVNAPPVVAPPAASGGGGGGGAFGELELLALLTLVLGRGKLRRSR